MKFFLSEFDRDKGAAEQRRTVQVGYVCSEIPTIYVFKNKNARGISWASFDSLVFWQALGKLASNLGAQCMQG